ncbi:MAG: hypothetical protein K2X77_03690 [Candidatus Obscuribacterales bacterium]|nr:hypothetical protein [Candidatus Obscuribacterales bacterium]
MNIPCSLKQKMYLVAAVGLLCQLDVQAKPSEPNNLAPPNSADSKPDANKTKSLPPPSINKDERRRQLRERFEKMRKNPRLRKSSVQAGESESSLNTSSTKSAEPAKARVCEECGRG